MAKKSKNTTGTTNSTSMEQLSDQLNGVTVDVLHNIMKMDLLHQQWLNYLFVLSFIVVLVSIYQIYSNFNSNYTYIADTGNHNHQLLRFIHKLPKPIQVLLHIDYSIVTYVISACMSVFLFLFIMVVRQRLEQQQPLSNSMTVIFRNFYFRMTQFFILPTMMLYGYQSKNNSQSNLAAASTTSSVKHQQFPIVIIYFVVVTVCIWFMQYQSQRMYRSYNAIVRLRNEFMLKQQQQQERNVDQRSSGNGKKKK